MSKSKKNMISGFGNMITPQIREQIQLLFDKMKSGNEFEFIFFSKKGKYLSLEKYINLLKYFSKKSKSDQTISISEPVKSLDVIYMPDSNTNLRCSLEGSHISQYMQRVRDYKNHVIFSTLVKIFIKESKEKKQSNISITKKTKNPDNVIDIDDFDIRLRLSEETVPPKSEITSLSELNQTNMSKIVYRFKQRTSINIHQTDDNFVRIDLTETKTAISYDKINKAVPTYELEIEYGTSKKPEQKYLDMMYEQIEILLKIIQNSNFIISQTKTKQIIQIYQNMFSSGNKKATKLDGRQSVSLEIQHVTEKLPNRYAVTDKADGTRYFMLISDNHVYMIDKNLEVKDTGLELSEKLSVWNGTVLDGEYIFVPDKNRYLYLIFDCLFVGTTDIRPTVNLLDRLKRADEVIEKCFILGKQKGYSYKDVVVSGAFNLDKIISLHYEQIKSSFAQMNKDMEYETEYPLIRRKYFISAQGAKNWEIFAYASNMYKYYTDDSNINCPYVLDGLIFQPLEQPYITSVRDSQKDDYKWKPPHNNSIDFYVEFEKDRDGKILTVYDNSYSENVDENENTIDFTYVRNKTYKICNLYVGNKDKDKEMPELFREEESLHQAYIYLSDPSVGSVSDVRDIGGDIISDKTVVEFYYNNDPNVLQKFRWVPMRTRYDKTESVVRFGTGYGNYKTTADKVWRSITNPVLMTDIDDLAVGNNPAKNDYSYDKKMELLRKRIGQNEIKLATREDKYYQEQYKSAEQMRKFNGFIKSNLIYTFLNKVYQGGRQLSVYDIGCGVGGDLMKFYYPNVKFYVGTDIDNNGINSATDGCKSRYDKFRKSKPDFPKMYFAQADSTVEMDYESQLKSLRTMDEENKQVIQRFFPSDLKKRTMFDCFNCQFAIHYMLRDDISWKNFKSTINRSLRYGGYFIATTFDANRIIKLLEGKDNYKYEYTNSEGKNIVLFDIVKKYSENIDSKTVVGTGFPIDVMMNWIARDVYRTEYLVDSRFLVNELEKDCMLELVDTDNFGNQYMIHKDYLTKYSKFESNPKTRKFLQDVAEFYKDSIINRGCLVWTNLFRYYVFRKKDAINSGMQGGAGNILDFSNTELYEIPSISSDYSCMNSIYHILKHNSVIPKHVGLNELMQDIGYKILSDSEITYGNLETLSDKLVINHQVEKANRIEEQKVIDGLNIFIVEKDCNDEYDIDLIKKKSYSFIILLKQGEMYQPVYYIDPKNAKRNGIFHHTHNLIKEMMKQID